MNTKKTILKIAIALTVFLGVLNTAYALNDYTVLSPLPGTFTGPCPATGCTTDLKTYLPGLFNFAIGLAAIMAFVMITYGGIMYMTSDAISGKSQGKEYITNAIYGLVLVIGSWVILHTINPKILEFNLSIPKPNVTTTTVIVDATSLQPGTLNALADLTTKCACSFTPTSTTGDTHNTNSLHYQGKAVDLPPSTKLDTFVKTGQSGISSGCTTYTQTLGGKTTIFLWEPKGATCGGTIPSSGDHWHVSVP